MPNARRNVSSGYNAREKPWCVWRNITQKVVRSAYLFGSLTQAGRFRSSLDIDIALERELQRDVDVRPLTGAVKAIATQTGELVYER